MLLISATLSLVLSGSQAAVISVTAGSAISVEDYDKAKHCASDLSKQPTSIEYLTYFNCGHVSKESDGQTIRDFTLVIEEDQEIPISTNGHIFDGWTFNGTIPGPTMRVTEGDHVRIKVINSASNTRAHSFHTHSIHPAAMDGVAMGGYEGGAIPPGGSFVYEFDAQPYGVYPYHCHVDPIADHINRGLYGMFIIDTKTPRPQMGEFAMLMNGYDLNFDQEGPVTIPAAAAAAQESNNEQQISKSPVLKVSHDHLQGNGDAGKDNKLKQTDQSQSDSQDTPANEETIPSDATKVGQKSDQVQVKSISSNNDKELKEGTEAQKDDNQDASADEVDAERDNEIYTVNGKAFDYTTHPIAIQAGKPYRIYLVNMLEFDLVNSFHMHGNMYNYTIAGTEEIPNFVTDLVTLSQGDRGIIEFQYDYPGKYMFHAHQTEFTDLGWMGLFEVKPSTPANTA